MEPTPITEGTWYYFTLDLDFKGYASFRFRRFLKANDRTAALVEFVEPKFFSTRELLLLPCETRENFFFAEPHEILSIWTFDGSNMRTAESVDLRSQWTSGIMDKAAITPSQATAAQWAGKSAA
jgi:hypothetical protein